MMKYGDLMATILSGDNLRVAFGQVVANRGSAGVDGMEVDDLREYLSDHFGSLKQALVSGSYVPQPVLKVEIPKANGGIRQLGIPTVIDRMIQQAIHQVLSQIWDPTFSEYSYGFRPRRNASQALAQATDYIPDRSRRGDVQWTSKGRNRVQRVGWLQFP